MNNSIDTEYIILENLYEQDQSNLSLKQRDLAQLARTSLGMINSILKRMVQKGWIKIKKVNSRNIRYAITLEGINEVFRRSYSYFKRTIKNVAYYRDAIGEIMKNSRDKKIKTVLLIGHSDLDFIIEHLCNYYGFSFLKSADSDFPRGGTDDSALVFYAENIQFSGDLNAANCVFISQLLINMKAAS